MAEAHSAARQPERSWRTRGLSMRLTGHSGEANPRGEFRPYIRRDDAAREAQVAELVARARREAIRRAREAT